MLLNDNLDEERLLYVTCLFFKYGCEYYYNIVDKNDVDDIEDEV